MPMLTCSRKRSVLAVERLAHRVDDACRDPACVGEVVEVLEDDRELVTAETGDGVLGSHAREEALGDALQHRVTCRVTEAVVRVLEAVEIAEDDRDPSLARFRERECRVEALGEQQPVGQSGERVVQREPAEFGLLGPKRLDRRLEARGEAVVLQHDDHLPDEHDADQHEAVDDEEAVESLVPAVLDRVRRDRAEEQDVGDDRLPERDAALAARDCARALRPERGEREKEETGDPSGIGARVDGIVDVGRLEVEERAVGDGEREHPEHDEQHRHPPLSA